MDSSAPQTPSAPAPPGPSTRSPSGGTAWFEELRAAVRFTGRWVARPRVRLCLIGGLLLLTGGVLVTNSVWTLPLVVVGALMVVVAWIGRRLEGRFVLEWGEAGTELALRATIKAPPRLEASGTGAGGELAPAPAPDRQAAPEDVIEGEAHTVEIDVADLRALIAAVEAGESSQAAGATDTAGDETGSAAALRDIRIRRAVRGGRAETR